MGPEVPTSSQTLYVVGTVAVTVVVALSCEPAESLFEPHGQGERLPIGSVIEDEVRGDSVNWYSVAAGPNELFVVFLEVLEGQVLLTVYDSTHGTLVSTLTAVAGGQALDENPSDTFGSSTGAVYRLAVVGMIPADRSARFRLKVYAINQATELVAAVFALGDTVTGETIDPMVDFDRFVAHGDSGQEIVAVAETQGPAGSGPVVLDVRDPMANTVLGYVFAGAGASNLLTTGRMRLAGTRDYRFTVSSVISKAYPRYRGPYRFWTYVINRAPEHRLATIPFNTEIGNERIDRAGDVDEFTFGAASGDEYNAFVQGAGRTFQLEVAPQGGATFVAATSLPSDTALFAHATNRFEIATSGTYIVRVTGTDQYQVADIGAYRCYLYKIDRRPEYLPEAIAPGDTVTGEDIGIPGDVDEFTFDGAAGDEFNAFLRAENGSFEAQLQLEVLNSVGTILGTTQSVGTDTSLLRQPTGRFALPESGRYRLRVTGPYAYAGEAYRGPYRLFLYRINRRPETLRDTLAFGDSLSGEAIDVPGDLDEFQVTVPDSSGANVALALDSPPDGGQLMIQLVDPATGAVIATASTGQTATRVATGRIRVAPGEYIVRVSTSDFYPNRLRGPYRVWFYRFGFGPEAVPDTFVVGDTVSGEAIEPWGDADQFRFYGLKGQHVNIMAQGLAAPSSGEFGFFVTPPSGSPGQGPFIFTPTAASALEDHQTTRVDLPATGWYTVAVSGGSNAFSERGPYRFAVLPIDPAPEHVSAALAMGDSVTTEPIDALGDWDEFTVAATPAHDVSVITDGRDSFTGPFAYAWVFDPATLDTLVFQPLQFRRIAGPFRVPASAQFKIAVFEPAGFFRTCYDTTCGGVYRFVGSYSFRVVPVNRAPEAVPAAYAVGDTVRGETISPVGDIDEFTATATPGEQLTPYLRLTTQASVDSAAVLEVIDVTSGASLVGSNVAIFGATFTSVGSFTVPASGAFLIRVRVYGQHGEGVGETSYEFFVKRGM